jgi:hypothetical protein
MIGEIAALAAGESTPETPSQAEAKEYDELGGGGRQTDDEDSEEVHVWSATVTARRTEDSKALSPRYVKFEPASKSARPTIAPDDVHMTAEVFVPPQSTQRYKDIGRLEL